MEIRKATAEDAREVSEIARAAKAHWNYPEKWLALWREALTIEPEFILENEVYATAETDRIAGLYALVIAGDRARLEHLWISPEFIGTGIGRRLFMHAAERAAAPSRSNPTRTPKLFTSRWAP
jgi:ribosomal protein S18 acetylase RimI-like enzyme